MKEKEFRDYLKTRFGIILPEGIAFEGDNSIRVMNSELKEFKTTTPKGIPASRMKGKFPKPTTAFIQLFGHPATKNTIDLPRKDALAYLQGNDLETKESPETGYVILKFKNAALGIGFFREGENKIRNMLPKRRRIHPTQG